jgi:hypothetical protein
MLFHLPQLIQRYVQYRRVGFGRLAAWRFAWLVAAPPHRPQSVR